MGKYTPKDQQYAIYDNEDNYIFGGNKLELAWFLDRPVRHVDCLICRYFKGQLNHVTVNGKYCKLYKIESD